MIIPFVRICTRRVSRCPRIKLKEDTRKFLKELFSGGFQASAIGFSLVFAILIGGGLGYWLSQVFDNMVFFYLALSSGSSPVFETSI